jgi:hypothetical protein
MKYKMNNFEIKNTEDNYVVAKRLLDLIFKCHQIYFLHTERDIYLKYIEDLYTSILSSIRTQLKCIRKDDEGALIAYSNFVKSLSKLYFEIIQSKADNEELALIINLFHFLNLKINEIRNHDAQVLSANKGIISFFELNKENIPFKKVAKILQDVTLLS